VPSEIDPIIEQETAVDINEYLRLYHKSKHRRQYNRIGIGNTNCLLICSECENRKPRPAEQPQSAAIYRKRCKSGIARNLDALSIAKAAFEAVTRMKKGSREASLDVVQLGACQGCRMVLPVVSRASNA
jgi:hypothetical protein